MIGAGGRAGTGYRRRRPGPRPAPTGRPTTVDGELADVPARVRDAIRSLDWVRDVAVRLREEGHVLVGEAFVLAAPGALDVARLEEAARTAVAVDWRVHEVVVTAVSRLPADRDEARAGDTDEQR